VIANLELMPLRMNSAKRDHLGDHQLSLAKKFRAAGLLTPDGLQRIQVTALRSSR
jgi:hypothetical protein